MYAVDDLSDAIDVTRNFLTPVDLRTWIKLAVVVFFVASLGMGGPPTPTGGASVDTDSTGDGGFEEFRTEFEGEFGVEPTLEDVLPILAVLVAVGALLWLVFAIVGAIMEFVLLESLRTTTVRVRAYGRENLGRAMHLFGFRLVLGLLGLALVVGPAAYVLTGAETLDDVAVGSLVAIGIVGFGYYLLYGLVMRLTTEFVAPVMLLEDRGVLGAWRRFWSTLVGSWAEYVVYVLVVTLLAFLVGIAVSFVALLVGLLIGIPTAIVAFLLVSVAGPVGGALALVVVLLAIALFVLLVTLVQVPIVTYVRYYALLVLGDTNPDLDLIPDQRAAVRTDESAGGEPPSRV